MHIRSFYFSSFNLPELLHLLSVQVKEVDLNPFFPPVSAFNNMNVIETIWRE